MSKTNEFNKFKEISAHYKASVDALGGPYTREIESDAPFCDAVREQRDTERRARYNAQIDQLAQSAADHARGLIGELDAALTSYITRSQPERIATLQALIAGGVELKDSEIAAFADGAAYSTLRLLERPSHGHVVPPDIDAMRRDLNAIKSHFDGLKFYRGDLAKIGTLSMFGQSSTVSSIAVSNSIDGFPAHLDEIATRWACVLGGGAK